MGVLETLPVRSLHLSLTRGHDHLKTLSAVTHVPEAFRCRKVHPCAHSRARRLSMRMIEPLAGALLKVALQDDIYTYPFGDLLPL